MHICNICSWSNRASSFVLVSPGRTLMVPHACQCLLGLSQASPQTQTVKVTQESWPSLEPLLVVDDTQGKDFIWLSEASIFLLDYDLNTFDVKRPIGPATLWILNSMVTTEHLDFCQNVQGRRRVGGGSAMDFQKRNSRSPLAPLAQRERNGQCDPK